MRHRARRQGLPPGTKAKSNSGFDQQAATVLDGVLKNATATDGISASAVAATGPDTPPQPSVNLLV